jgi:chromosome segregation ATPase
MPKKRLTDLLREEAEKSSELATNSPVNPTESTDDLTDSFSDESSPNIPEPAAVRAADSHSVSASADRAELPSVTLTELQAALQLERTTVEKLEIQLKQAEQLRDDLAKAQENLQADLQASQSAIKQVEADAKKANQRYEKLAKTHADVANELQDQKQLVKKLQTDLKNSEKIQDRLKSELETVSNTARRFSEENQSLQEQLTALQQENQALKQQHGRLVYQPDDSILSKDKFLYNPLSDEDIGWFD